MNKDFKNYIRSQEVEPPTEIWEAIENELDGKSKKRKFVYWPYFIAILLLVGIGFGYFYQNHSQDLNIQTKNQTSINQSNPDNDQKSSQIDISETITPEETKPRTYYEPKLQNQYLSNFQSKSDYDVVKPQNVYSSNHSAQAPLPYVESVSSENLSNNALTHHNTTNSYNDELIVKAEAQTSIQQNTAASETLPSQNNSLSEPNIMASDTELKTADSNADSLNSLTAKNEIEVKEVESKKKKWEVSGFISPSYTRSISKDNIWLVDLYEYNGKYEDATNYGLQMQYNVNEKWSVRTGIESTTLKQKAYNVKVIPQSLNNIAETDINYVENFTILQSEDFNNNIINLAELQNANVNQSISYLSIPIEVGYTLYNSKIIQMNTYLGSSFHILQNNSISISEGNFKTEIGSAKNLNKFVMGTQFGIQTRFRITPRIGFNFEPKFIYYYNTFNENNSVRPYTINLNTGFLYSF